MTPPPVHAVPFDAPKGRDHRQSTTCWCGPTAFGTDLATAAIVWRHRTPGDYPARIVPVRRSEDYPGRPAGQEIQFATVVEVIRARSAWDSRPFSIGRLAEDLGDEYGRTREAVIRFFGSAKAAALAFENSRPRSSIA
jgi:hypothetical protein